MDLSAPVPTTVADHLRGKPEQAVVLYRKFVELIGERGPFGFAPSRAGIAFTGSRRGFAGGLPTSSGVLVGYLDLPRLVTGPQINNALPAPRRLVTHQFRIDTLDEFDDAFVGWIGEAYLVGQGATGASLN